MLKAIARTFRMSDEAWRRHAHPWSVYTRFAALPPLVLAVWSRTWIGWWSLGLLGVVLVWLWLNPRVFPPIHEPTSWASKGIYGERIWLRENRRVPRHHRSALRLIAIPGVAGIALLAWSLVALAVWPSVAGVTLVVIAQLWRIDRLAWMYAELLPDTSTAWPPGGIPPLRTQGSAAVAASPSARWDRTSGQPARPSRRALDWTTRPPEQTSGFTSARVALQRALRPRAERCATRVRSLVSGLARPPRRAARALRSAGRRGPGKQN